MTDLPDVTNYPEPTEDELTEILKPYSWHDFENTVDGHLRLGNAQIRLDLIDFYLRVGLFMIRPMRVVMACGKYVWMKEEPAYLAHFLCALDPLHPEKNLYPNDFIDVRLGWRPCPAAQQAGWLQLQNLQQQQVYASQMQQQAPSPYAGLLGPVNQIGLGYAPTLPRVK